MLSPAQLPGAATLFCLYPHVRHIVVQPGKTGRGGGGLGCRCWPRMRGGPSTRKLVGGERVPGGRPRAAQGRGGGGRACTPAHLPHPHPPGPGPVRAAATGTQAQALGRELPRREELVAASPGCGLCALEVSPGRMAASEGPRRGGGDDDVALFSVGSVCVCVRPLLCELGGGPGGP